MNTNINTAFMDDEVVDNIDISASEEIFGEVGDDVEDELDEVATEDSEEIEDDDLDEDEEIE